jgi:hypothetical protein
MRASRLVPVLAAALLAAGLTAPLGAAATTAASPGRGGSFRDRVTAYRPTGRLQVRFKTGVTATRQRSVLDRVAATGHALHVDRRIPGLNAAVLSVDSARAVQSLLRDDPTVAYVEAESRYKAFDAEPVSPELTAVGADTVHDTAPSNVGAGSEIAIIDSRVSETNTDLDDVGKVVYGGDFSTAVPTDPADPYQTQNFACDAANCPHGTAVAAVAAADAGDGGMAGVAPGATIRSYNVFRRFVYTNPDPQPGDPLTFESVGANSGDIVAALDAITADAASRGALVAVNMSLGGSFDSQLIRDAIAALHAALPKATVVVASGNDGSERANFPAGDPYVLSVGATGQLPDSSPCSTAITPGTPWTVTGFSNRGDVDVVAPGRCVTSYWPPEDADTGAVTGPAVLDKVDGTSFAAPMTAGVLALLGAATPPVTGDAARAAVMAGADHTGTTVASGTGQVKAPAALAVAAGPGTYTALSVVRGAQVATTVGRRSLEALRVDPGGTPPAAAVLSVPAAFGSIGPRTTTTSGGVTRTTATYAAPPDNKAGLGSALTATGSATAADTATVPLKMLDAGDNHEGLPAANNEQTSVALTYGSRTAYIRSAAVTNTPLTWTWTFDPHGYVDPGFAQLFVWEPATNGGTADAGSEPIYSAFDETASEFVAPNSDQCEQTGPSTFRLCRPGRYLVGWTLTSSNDDSDATSRYRLKLSYNGPAPTVTAPAVVSTVSSTAPFRVYWGGARAVKWDVYYAQKKKVGSAWVLGAWVPWQLGTTAVSAPFGVGNAPVAVAPGYTYHFQVRGYDALGNPSLPISTNAVEPLDDSSYHLAYSKGWGAGAAANRWYGGVHYTTTAGASVSVSAETERFTLVGERCPTCGGLRVYVDGVLKATVDTRATATQIRQSLWTSALLPGGPKPHTFKVVALGTAGRPRVVVDGIATLR